MLPTVRLVPAPPALGKGALDVELRFDVTPRRDASAKGDKKNEKKSSFALHALLMGEPQSTWIAFGANRDELVSRMLAAKAGAPEGGTLAARPGLEPLRSGKAVSSGFITLGSVTRSLASALTNPAVGQRANLGDLPPAPSTTCPTRERHRSFSPRPRPATGRAASSPSTCRRGRWRTSAPSS